MNIFRLSLELYDYFLQICIILKTTQLKQYHLIFYVFCLYVYIPHEFNIQRIQKMVSDFTKLEFQTVMWVLRTEIGGFWQDSKCF